MDKQRHIIFLTTLLNVQARSVILWKPDKPEVWKRLLQTKKAQLGVFDVVDCSCYLEGSFNRTHLEIASTIFTHRLINTSTTASTSPWLL